MTTVPNEATSSINHERSPVLLTSEADQNSWLSGTDEEAMSVVRPTPGAKLRIVQEGFEKKDLLGQ